MSKFKRVVKRAQLSPEDNWYRKTNKCGWSPYVNGLSPSGLQLWLHCQEQFRLCYVEGLKLDVAKLPLEFGSIVHHVLEYARAEAKPPNKQFVFQQVQEYVKKWKKDHPAAGTASLEMLDTAAGYAEAVMPVYFQRYAGDWKGFKYPAEHKNHVEISGRWVGMESFFKVPYVFPDGKTMFITGRRDGVFKSKKGNVWVLDTKCFSRFEPQEVLATLNFDVQQMIYVWASAYEMKAMVDGIVLDVVRRPGQYKKKDDTKAKYFRRVHEEVADKKNWDHYFCRLQCDLRKDDLGDWLEAFFHPCMASFRSWWEGSAEWCGGTIHHFMNPESLIGKYGRCDYFEWITTGFSMGMKRRKTGS